MKKIGFITSIEDPQVGGDDHLAFQDLESLGFQVSPVIWDHYIGADDSGLASLQGWDGLVFRSCWNYHRKHSEFLGFLDRLKKSRIPVLNPIATIEWNLNKKHLLELASEVVVPKTLWLEAGTSFSSQVLEKARKDWKVDSLVIKPAVSLNGHDTYRVSKEGFEKTEATVLELLKNRDVLIQEFIPEIKTQGETSLVFFNRKLSHAVRKLPAENEFRIHREYGGTHQPTDASPEALRYSEKLLSVVPGELLYARVDIVETSKGPVLIELEVTDPMLYLHAHPNAAKNFATAVAKAFS
jgi:glutathione synthase/RimK-type ligase-like ATP-grasp enzyme